MSNTLLNSDVNVDEVRSEIVRLYDAGPVKDDSPSSVSLNSLVKDRFGLIVDPKKYPSTAKSSANNLALTKEEIHTERDKQDRWLKILKNWSDCYPSTKVRKRIFAGIPTSMRGEVWKLILEVPQRVSLYPNYYENIKYIARHSSPDIRQIDLDINRTFRNHIMFYERYGVKQRSLLHVLASYTIHNKEVGYCQGMSSVAALLLMYMNEEDAFWALSTLLTGKRHSMHGLFIAGFPKLMRFQDHHDKIMQKMLPNLFLHFQNEGCMSSLYSLKWYMQCFMDRVPFGLVLRLWDIFILEGDKILHPVGYTLLSMYKKDLMRMNLEALGEFLGSGMATLDIDIDNFMKTVDQNVHELKKLGLYPIPTVVQGEVPVDAPNHMYSYVLDSRVQLNQQQQRISSNANKYHHNNNNNNEQQDDEDMSIGYDSTTVCSSDTKNTITTNATIAGLSATATLTSVAAAVEDEYNGRHGDEKIHLQDDSDAFLSSAMKKNSANSATSSAKQYSTYRSSSKHNKNNSNTSHHYFGPETYTVYEIIDRYRRLKGKPEVDFSLLNSKKKLAPGNSNYDIISNLSDLHIKMPDRPGYDAPKPGYDAFSYSSEKKKKHYIQNNYGGVRNTQTMKQVSKKKSRYLTSVRLKDSKSFVLQHSLDSAAADKTDKINIVRNSVNPEPRKQSAVAALKNISLRQGDNSSGGDFIKKGSLMKKDTADEQGDNSSCGLKTALRGSSSSLLKGGGATSGEEDKKPPPRLYKVMSLLAKYRKHYSRKSNAHDNSSNNTNSPCTNDEENDSSKETATITDSLSPIKQGPASLSSIAQPGNEENNGVYIENTQSKEANELDH